MRREKRLGQEISAARMTHASHEQHFLRHCRIRRLSLYCSAGIVRLPFPFFHASRRPIHMAAQSSLVRFFFFLGRVRVIAQHRLGKRHVDLSFVVLQQFLPSRPPRVRSTFLVIWTEFRRLFLEHLGVPRPVRSC